MLSGHKSSDMQPIVVASGVHIMSCAGTLEHDQIKVAFNGDPGEWEIAGRDTIYAIPRSALIDGKVQCEVTVTDTLGNETKQPFEFVVDGQPPELGATVPPGGGSIPAQEATFSAELTDGASGVDLDSVTLSAWFTPANGTTGRRHYRILDRGAYLYDIKELRINKGDHLTRPKFQFKFPQQLSEGTLKFSVTCTDLAEHEMRAAWDVKITGK